MLNSYLYKVDGKIVTISDEVVIEEKENHEKIEDELNLKNEIEILNNSIEENKFDKDYYQKLKHKLFKYPKVTLLAMAAIYFGVSAMMGFKSWPIANEHLANGYVALLITEAILCTPFIIPITIIDCIRSKTYKNNLKKLDVMLEYLEKELTKKQEELKELQNSKVKTEAVDTEIHKLDTKSYNEQLKNELVELYNYCEDLKKDEELRQEHGVQLKLQKNQFHF